MDKITQSQVKLVRSLRQKKFRDDLDLFVAEGDKCIGELKPFFALELLATTDNATTTQLEQMSSLKSPQGSIAVFRKPHFPSADMSLLSGSLFLALDNIQDPGNLGTIIRTCDWFGVHDIFCSRDTVDCFSPKVVQATMGALSRVHLHYVDLPQWLASVPADVPVYGTLLDGRDMYMDGAISKQRGGIVIMGNEGNGISIPVRRYITHPLYIPSAEGEHVESLNVAVATAVTLSEIYRYHR